MNSNAKVDKTLKLEKGEKSEVLKKEGISCLRFDNGKLNYFVLSSILLSLALTYHMLWGLVVNDVLWMASTHDEVDPPI